VTDRSGQGLINNKKDVVRTDTARTRRTLRKVIKPANIEYSNPNSQFRKKTISVNTQRKALAKTMATVDVTDAANTERVDFDGDVTS